MYLGCILPSSEKCLCNIIASKLRLYFFVTYISSAWKLINSHIFKNELIGDESFKVC